MRFRGAVVLASAVLVAVAVGAGLGLAPVPGDAQEEGAASGGTTRYRVTVLRLALPADAHGEPLTIVDLGGAVPGAIVPAAGSPGASGHLGALPDRPDLIEKIGAKGSTYEVIFRGETESAIGRRSNIDYGQRFPVHTLDIRSGASIVTTRFEKIGFSLDIERSAGRDFLDGHTAKFEVSSVSATRGGRDPVFFSVSAAGTIRLPDGYTAVFSYLDRVEGFCFALGPEDLAAGALPGEEVPPDVVVQYFVLITRLDLKE